MFGKFAEIKTKNGNFYLSLKLDQSVSYKFLPKSHLNPYYMKHPASSNAFLEPKTKAQLASAMNISLSTLQRRLQQSGLKIPRGYIPPDLQQAIYKELGWARLA